MADINLTKAVRSNLMSLQGTAALMSKTSDRLSTGNKVNTALDNPSNFFTAQALNSRAGDLNSLMDSMQSGVKIIEAADKGLTAITKNLESMQSTLRQARQDKTFLTASYTTDSSITDTSKTIDFAGGAVGTSPVSISLAKTIPAVAGAKTTHVGENSYVAGDYSFTVNGDSVTLTAATENNIAAAVAKVNADLGSTHAVEAYEDSGKLALRNKADGTAAITVAGADATNAGLFGNAVVTAGAVGTPATTVAKTADELVNEINADNSPLKGKVRASNDNGKLRLENLSTQDLKVDGVSSTGKIDGASTDSQKIGGNQVRTDLASQFNELRDQLDKLSDDASFNGINLLRGDNLKITFNETGTSSIDIHTKGEKAVNTLNLGVSTTLQAKDLDNDGQIDAFLDQVKSALNQVRSQASSFGSNLSIVQNRLDFTKNMINTLETGAGNLTLADMNLEAANMMALQTRQALAQSTLSMANQADQGVLQLLR